MDKINENRAWLEQNHHVLDEASFLKFQEKVGELFSKSIQAGAGITVNAARKQAIAWFV
ncbi:MAG: hypothetical protein WC856_02185 [Methylococcaceae bacterium]|jgi:hypothetical protein